MITPPNSRAEAGDSRQGLAKTKALLIAVALIAVGAFVSVYIQLMPREKAPTRTLAPTEKFSLQSPAFQEGGRIPTEYTSDGTDISPPLSWSGSPEGAKTFALIVDDPDAPSGAFTHWVIFNIPGTARQLRENLPGLETLPDGSVQGTNDFGKIGYGGPSPPSGSTHKYRFRIYAVDTQLKLPAGSSKQELLSAIDGHVLATGELTGKYGR